MAVWAVVVAAGSGNRFGGSKQFEPLGGRRVLDWSLQAARAVCDGVTVVVPAGEIGAAGDEHAVVGGGPTRAASVRSGLAAVPDDVEVIVVHDGVRPLAGPSLFRSVVEALGEGIDAVVPVLPVSDTIKRVEGGRVRATVGREGLMAAQTPQAFRAAKLRAVHSTEPEGTDDACLVEAAGGAVLAVPGDPANLKITDPCDLVVAEALLAGASGQDKKW